MFIQNTIDDDDDASPTLATPSDWAENLSTGAAAALTLTFNR